MSAVVYVFAFYGAGVLVGFVYSVIRFDRTRRDEFVTISLALSAAWPFYLYFELEELVKKCGRK